MRRYRSLGLALRNDTVEKQRRKFHFNRNQTSRKTPTEATQASYFRFYMIRQFQTILSAECVPSVVSTMIHRRKIIARRFRLRHIYIRYYELSRVSVSSFLLMISLMICVHRARSRTVRARCA